MKNKKNIYFLIPAVLIIWGLIAYKIFSAVNPTADLNLVTNEHRSFIPDSLQAEIEFKLDLNYRDPFLGRIISKKPSANKKTSKHRVKKTEIQFPSIVYNGLIKPKEKSRTTLYMVSINNKQHFLSAGTEIGGVTLLTGDDKEISIQFQKTKKQIPIQ